MSTFIQTLSIRERTLLLGDGESQRGSIMQAGILMITYVLTTVAVQFVGFLISRLVEYQFPTLGLIAFLVLFIGAFGIAWPIAVRIAEWLIQKLGYQLEEADPRAT